MATKGICIECGEALEDSGAYGYHTACADKAFEREDIALDKRLPFVVVASNGAELKRFAFEEEAKEYLFNIQNAEIIDKS